MKERIMEYLPSFMNHKRLLGNLILLTLLVFAVSFTTSHLLISYHDKQQKEAQIAAMQTFLTDWKDKSQQINTASMRPVDVQQVDMVQTAILFNVQTYQLNLLNMKDAQKSNQPSGHIYTMEFSGAYENTMQCLKNFRAKDALIGIQHIKMEMQNGQINTKLTYKIYTK